MKFTIRPLSLEKKAVRKKLIEIVTLRKYCHHTTPKSRAAHKCAIRREIKVPR